MGNKIGKIEVWDGDGKTRDERETCFPNTMQNHQTRQAGMR